MTGETSTAPAAGAKRAKVVEQVALTLQSSGLRKIAFASVDTDPTTSALARDVAEVVGRSGLRTLLVDLSGGAGNSPAWLPGDKAKVTAARQTGDNFDSIHSPSGAEARAAYNNPARAAVALDGLLKQYDLIILNLRGLADDAEDAVNAIAAGAAADGIVLLSPMALISVGRLDRMLSQVAAAGGKIVGTVVDDRANPLLGEDMANSMQSLFGLVPSWGSWIGTRLRRSEFLRTPLYS